VLAWLLGLSTHFSCSVARYMLHHARVSQDCQPRVFILLVCVFTNKRPSVVAKTSPAPNNVPVQAFRRASSIQAEKPVCHRAKIEPAFCRCPGRLRDLSSLQDIPAVPHKLHVHP